MGRTLCENHQENGTGVQLSAPSEITVSPVLLWVIVSVAAIFFISGGVHVLLRFLKKNQTYPPISQSNSYNELYRPQSLQTQLQQLFRIHDSGLDPSFIDSLPVFEYKHITGTKDPFDCAVCLCEFSHRDKLRLIPVCSHAFHTHCIDTWLLSNSTCPLCRVNLRESFMNISTNSVERVLSVRLGKLKSFNGGDRSNGKEISRSNLDARRCFSMGSFQYVMNGIDLQVALLNVKDNVGCARNEDVDNERKIRYESFSVSKVWLWSKKDKFQVSSSEHEVGSGSSQNIIVPNL